MTNKTVGKSTRRGNKKRCKKMANVQVNNPKSSRHEKRPDDVQRDTT